MHGEEAARQEILEQYASLCLTARTHKQLKMHLINEGILDDDGKVKRDLEPGLLEELRRVKHPDKLSVIGNHFCDACDEAYEVKITIDGEPDLPAILIEGLHVHMGSGSMFAGSVKVKLPSIYITTHDQLTVRERRDLDIN